MLEQISLDLPRAIFAVPKISLWGTTGFWEKVRTALIHVIGEVLRMNRSLGVLGLSFSHVLVALAIVCTHPLLVAEELRSRQEITAEMEELIQQGKDLQQKPLTNEMEELIQRGREAVGEESHSEEIKTLVEDGKQVTYANPLVGEDWLQNGIRKSDSVSKEAGDNSILIFASYSLGKQGLNELLEGAAGYPNAVVVFRGIPAGMGLGEGVKKIQEMAAKKNPVPNVVINPTLFERYAVTDVPTIVLLKPGLTDYKPNESPVLASVKGLSDPLWLLNLTKQGGKGDQGVQGAIVPIKEPDLIKVMQARAMAIDWDEKKQSALERCWNNLPNYRLPTVTKKLTRVIDPTVVVTQDIVTPDGNMIARAGTKINPLSLRPFTQLVVVFDPLDKTHLPRIHKALPALKQQNGVQKVTYIATQFCSEKGLDGYKEISNAVNAPVYLLTPDIIERFELQHAPSIIHASSDHFLVEELADEK